MQDSGSIPGSGRSPGEEIGYPLQDSGLKNSMGSQRVRLSNFHFYLGHCGCEQFKERESALGRRRIQCREFLTTREPRGNKENESNYALHVLRTSYGQS